MDRRLMGGVPLVATYLLAVDHKEVRVARPMDATTANDYLLVDEQVHRLWVPVEEQAAKDPAALVVGARLCRVGRSVLGRVQRAISDLTFAGLEVLPDIRPRVSRGRALALHAR
jgi:hypothetical protein